MQAKGGCTSDLVNTTGGFGDGCTSPNLRDRALGASDGQIPASHKPGRILPARFTKQGQTGMGARPRESVGESGDPSRHHSQCAVERPAKRGRCIGGNGS